MLFKAATATGGSVLSASFLLPSVLCSCVSASKSQPPAHAPLFFHSSFLVSPFSGRSSLLLPQQPTTSACRPRFRRAVATSSRVSSPTFIQCPTAGTTRNGSWSETAALSILTTWLPPASTTPLRMAAHYAWGCECACITSATPLLDWRSPGETGAATLRSSGTPFVR